MQWTSPVTGKLENEISPVSDPVTGWLQINRINHALLVYRDDGQPLMEVFDHENVLKYRVVPNSALTQDLCPATGGFDDTLFEALKTVKVQAIFINFLKQLSALAFSANGSFKDFVAALVTRNENIISKNGTLDPATAAIMGRPLAVTEVALALELDGKPAVDQSQSSFNTFVESQKHDDKGISNVEFQIRVGDDSRFNDGMIGYFRSTGSTPFYLVGNDTKPNAPWTSFLDDTLSVAPADSTQMKYQKILALIDPSVPIHATSGILPVKELGIPLNFYQLALAKMKFVTFVSSIIAPDPANTHNLLAPKPRVSGTDWQWIEHSDNTASRWTDPVPVEQAPVGTYYVGSHLTLREGWLSFEGKTDTKGKNT